MCCGRKIQIETFFATSKISPPLNYSAELIDFEYPSSTYHRGFFLPLSKLNGLISVNVHSSEFFIVVMVVDGDLPVTMLAAFVITEACSLASLHLFHVYVPQRKSNISSRAPNASAKPEYYRPMRSME
jgi:hypothetical protein